MTKLDRYWQSNEDWYHYNDDMEPVMNDDAPEEAKESFKHYLEQVKEAKKRGAL